MVRPLEQAYNTAGRTGPECVLKSSEAWGGEAMEGFFRDGLCVGTSGGMSIWVSERRSHVLYAVYCLHMHRDDVDLSE